MWITMLHVAQCMLNIVILLQMWITVCCMLIGIILALSVVGGLVFYFIYNDDKEE